MTGFYTMLENDLHLPFETQILGVTDKGFISFAARKCRITGERLVAAKVMKPRSELNRETEAGL